MSLNFKGIQDFITRRVNKKPSVRSLETSDSKVVRLYHYRREGR